MPLPMMTVSALVSRRSGFVPGATSTSIQSERLRSSPTFMLLFLSACTGAAPEPDAAPRRSRGFSLLIDRGLGELGQRRVGRLLFPQGRVEQLDRLAQAELAAQVFSVP